MDWKGRLISVCIFFQEGFCERALENGLFYGVFAVDRQFFGGLRISIYIAVRGL